MNYVNHINRNLKPTITEQEIVLDLFAGCGGLSLGFEAAGYRTIGYEMDKAASETYNRNLKGHCTTVKLDNSYEYPEAQIIIGGPPCQPFSVGGHQKGIDDTRNGFPVFIDAVRKVKPDIFVFENVRGLLYTNKWYFEVVLKELSELGYSIDHALLNAVNYGVPQNRERLFVVGHKSEFSFPQKDKNKITVGEAIGDIMYTMPPESRFLNAAQDTYIAKYEKASDCVNPRDLYPEKPARTLTCRNLAGATGDMQRVRLTDGRRRRLLIREAARLQSFPDWFEFTGNETNQYNQIGNAVPPLLAYKIALAVKVCHSPPVPLTRNLKFKPYLMKNYIEKSGKNAINQRLINEALDILELVGIPFDNKTPKALQSMAMCFLAVAGITKSWKEAKGQNENRHLKTRDIIKYINEHYEENISPGSYDDMRRKHLKLLVLGDFILNSAKNPSAATNDPTRGYAISADFKSLITNYGTVQWPIKLKLFLKNRPPLAEILSRKRNTVKIPIKIPNGTLLQLSQGGHNQLQREIIEEFLPRFGVGCELLYIGDTSNKFLLREEEQLRKMGFFELSHDELPDIVAYNSKKNWLYLIEAFYSSGPMSEERVFELKKALSKCTAIPIFITAFTSRTDFKKHILEIAWESEVWTADNPEHMIHFNGNKFLGPH